jgi:ribosomal protein S18 acetylase RimI-like enzyme
MSKRTQAIELAPSVIPSLGSAADGHTIHTLTNTHESEVLEFLAVRPIHTVFMASLIRDNSIVSDFNRGCFFGCRSNIGALEGVALLGHATLIETESNECIRAFADVAKDLSLTHLIRGEQHKIESFWNYYTEGRRKPRLLCGELLLELKNIPEEIEPVPGLRQATIADLEAIVTVNASMACDESGINPLARDPQGFRERAARRISKGRIWVWIENELLLYKTDIIAETPQAVYLEGVYVHPEHRNQGYGLRCISQLAVSLLQRSETICLTVNEKSAGTQQFYKRAGYELVSRYDSIYLDKRNSSQNQAA